MQLKSRALPKKRATSKKTAKKAPHKAHTRALHNTTTHPAIKLTTTTKQQTRASHALSTHKDTPYNNANTPFEFTPESMEKINKVLKKFPANYKQSAVMPVLFIAQEQNDNWLPLTAMNKVAEMLDMPPMRVYEVATFYTMYNRDKVGKFHIQVCGTTTCMTMGAREIKKAAKKFAKVHHDNEVSADGLFCISEVECLGFCSNAPGIQVNNQWFYENLTEESIVNVMKGLVAGTAKPGPQNGQKCAEGPLGPKTLIGYEDHFPKFDMSRFDEKLKEMTATANTTAAPAAPAAAKPVEKAAEKPAPAAAAAKPVEKAAEKPAPAAAKAEEKPAAAPAAEKK